LLLRATILFINEPFFKKRSPVGNSSSTPEHRELHKEINITKAATQMRLMTDLSLVETISLWWSFLYYFRSKKPVNSNIKRIKKYIDQFFRQTNEINITQASMQLKLMANLSFIETISLWWSFLYYFHIKKPINRNIERFNKYICQA